MNFGSKIKLTNGQYALVSDEDYLELVKHKWYASREGRDSKWYAVRWSKKSEHGSGKRYKIRMHRVVMGEGPKPKDGTVVDHINGDSLDNRRENLRVINERDNGLGALLAERTAS